MKVSGYLNYKSLFDLFCENLFDGDYAECQKWWYDTPIVGLDGMYMDDLAKTSQGRTLAVAWAQGYLKGLSGNLD